MMSILIGENIKYSKLQLTNSNNGDRYESKFSVIFFNSWEIQNQIGL